MKKTVLITLCVFSSVLLGTALAGEVTMFGPKQYVRTSGSPDVYTDTFSAIPKEGRITVRNGQEDGSKRIEDAISSGIVKVNGEEIFGPNDFNKNVYLLEASLSLAESNLIEVELTSSPGSYITVEVFQDVDPPTVTIGADPESIILGDSSTLTWSSTNADTCVIEPGIGPVDPSGSTTVSPAETTTYTITATNLGGTATDTVTVTVVYPPTVSISADPDTVLLGDSSTLTWNSTNADSCVIEPDVGTVDPSGSITVSPALNTTYSITATGAGGTATDSATVTVLQPPTVTISASPDTILLGESSTLTWSSTHAETCVIEPGVGTFGPSGSTAVSPGETTIYTITATGPGGTATDAVTVTVHYPSTVSMSADPDTIALGESSTLTWTSTHAARCVIEPGVGPVDTSGSTTVSPSETTTYTITATGPGGTATDSVTVTVLYPPTVTIGADPESIIIGESSTLTWTSTYADTCVIEPGVGPVDTSGSTAVSPTETTTYTVTATGPGGTATDSVTVTVLCPPTVSISAAPDTIVLGESSTLTWSSTNADTCVIEPEVGTVDPNGSTAVSPTETTTYTITASGQGGTATDQTIVTVTGAVGPEPQPEGSFGEQYEDLVPSDATVESYDPKRFSVVTGFVQDLAGSPVSDVSVTIFDHQEYGSALTDAEGHFSIPVEGGSTLTAVYQKAGLLTVQRKVHVPWNDIAIAETITMIPEDPTSTTLTFDGNPGTVVTHQSSEVTDEFGSRSCSVVFTGDNIAYLVDEHGNDIEQLTTITARATEYTTEQSMPAVLPPNSAYTYCVELAVDGAQRVRFEKPVITWVENFLGFDVGMAVPVGYYDRDRSVWVPSDNGVVVKLLDTTGDGVADALDADGDDQPDDLTDDGTFTDEVTGLGNPQDYPPGSTFWRFAVGHFTPWDCNWPFGPPPGAGGPNPGGGPSGDGGDDDDDDDDCNAVGSYVKHKNRALHEDIPVPGTDIVLHYTGNRVEGYKTEISVPASGDTVPEPLKHITVKVELAGRTLEEILSPLPNQIAKFVWDGLDYWGNRISGPIPAHVSVGFVYDPFYYSPADFTQAFAQAGTDITSVSARQEIISWKRDKLTVNVSKHGAVVGKGWSLSVHHGLDPMSANVLYKGDGTTVTNTVAVLDTMAGIKQSGPGYGGDGGPAVAAELHCPTDLALDAVGNLYITEFGSHRIRKVDTTGIISTFAGTPGFGSYGGDGGPATDARLKGPIGITLDAAGNLYIADRDNHRIRKVDTSGIITTVAGMGALGYTGDGGPATEARLNYPEDVALDRAGNLYIADRANYRIRKVDTSGIITTIAGTGTWGYSGDGGPATLARLRQPSNLAVDAEGNLYIVDKSSHRIRKVDTSGIITTVAGNGSWGFSGDGGPATLARLNSPSGIALDAYGNLYISDNTNYRIRKVDTSGNIHTVAGNGQLLYGLPDRDPPTQTALGYAMGAVAVGPGGMYIPDYGNAVYSVERPTGIFSGQGVAGDISFAEANGLGHIFSGAGLHKRTIDLNTGNTLYEFGYENNDLKRITDQFGNEITIDRTPGEIAITSPDGITTRLMIDANNQLTQIVYPDASVYQFEYDPAGSGLLTAKIEPEGNRFDYGYNLVTGKLTDARDEEGGDWQYTREAHANGDVVTEVLAGEGNRTTNTEYTYSTGRFTSVTTDPTGAQALYERSADRLTVGRSLPCGVELTLQYDVDPLYKFQYVTSMSKRTPLGREKVTVRDKTYQDTNGDETPDLVTETVAVNGNASEIENNVLESKKTITSPEGRTVTIHYDPNTLLTTFVSRPGLHDTTYEYDTSGRLTSITTGDRTTIYAYNDQSGFLESVTDPEGHATGYQYDAIGRVAVMTRPDTGTMGFDYDTSGRLTTLTNPASIDHGFGYNKANLNNSYLAPISGEYTYEYDTERRLTRIVFPSNKTIRYIYDQARLDSIETPEGIVDLSYCCSTKLESMTKGGETIAYGYDGPLSTSETLGGTVTQVLSYEYDNGFHVTSFTYAGGPPVAYVYDNDGLLTAAGGFTIGRDAANGLPETVTDNTLTLTRDYNGYRELDGYGCDVNGNALCTWTVTQRDNVGRITEKTETVDSDTHNYTYAYDTVGRLTSVERDGVIVEEYQYDSDGTRTWERNELRGIAGRTLTYSDEDHLLSAGDATYQYDLDGFLTTKTQGTNVTTYNYSSRGELLSVLLADGREVEYVHDPLTRRIGKKIDGNITEKYLWQGLTRLLAVYDGSDNLLMRFEYANGRMPVAVTVNGVTYYLAYDQVGSLRLVADVLGNVVKKIDYDAFGNILGDTNPSFAIPLGFAGGLYDADTGLVRFGYRDYDPDVGRWTAKDPVLFAGGDVNLFAYVESNPISGIDPLGLETCVSQGCTFGDLYEKEREEGEWELMFSRLEGPRLGQMAPIYVLQCFWQRKDTVTYAYIATCTECCWGDCGEMDCRATHDERTFTNVDIQTKRTGQTYTIFQGGPLGAPDAYCVNYFHPDYGP